MGNVASLEARLHELYQAGRRAWPQIALDAAAFEARARRLAGTPDEAAALRAEDLYLAFACAEGDARAVETLERRYLPRVPIYLARLRKPPAFVDEVTQRLREKLLVSAAGGRARIADYAGRGALESWLCVVAVRLALDLAESEGRDAPAAEDLGEEAFGATADPELAYIRQRYLPQFREAFAQAMRGLSPEERNLLRFYLVDGLNIAQIGVIFEKSRATIGRWLVDCRERILDETKRALSTQLGSDQEVSSLVKLLHSQLDVSVREILLGSARRLRSTP